MLYTNNMGTATYPEVIFKKLPSYKIAHSHRDHILVPH